MFSITGDERVFTGRLVKVDRLRVESPRGVVFDREVVRHPGAVAILPVFDDGTVMLVKQFRAALGESILEAPAGKLSDREDPADCAHRELFEETGLRATSLTLLASFATTPGFSDEQLTAFMATGLGEPTRAGAAEPDGEEEFFLETATCRLDDWPELVASERVKDAKTIICLALAAGHLGIG